MQSIYIYKKHISLLYLFVIKEQLHKPSQQNNQNQTTLLQKASWTACHKHG